MYSHAFTPYHTHMYIRKMLFVYVCISRMMFSYLCTYVYASRCVDTTPYGVYGVVYGAVNTLCMVP